jgi:hypothetical protein
MIKMPNKKIIKKRNINQNKPISGSYIGAKIWNILNCNVIVFIIIVAVYLSFNVTIQMNYKPNFVKYPADFQVKDLTPDAKLYYGLAQNLVNGTGFYDTIRNAETLPSIGHPAFLALFCFVMGLSPGQFTWMFFMLSFVLLAAAIRIYCRSNILALLAIMLMEGFFRYIWWYSANVEATIIFANTLLAFGLAIFYKKNYSKKMGLVCGIILYIHLILRPIFLYPMHLFFVFLVFLFLYLYATKKTVSFAGFIRGWLVLLITAECLIWLTYGYSMIRYHDQRLVNGTYGALALYLGNTIYIPPDNVFDYRVKRPVEFERMMNLKLDNPGMKWQESHKILMNEVKKYWKEHPSLAVKGLWWRFRQFLGLWTGNFSSKDPIKMNHAFLVFVLFTMLVIRFALAFVKRKLTDIVYDLTNSLGVLFAGLFLIYCAFASLFSYIGFRYASVTIPLFIAVDAFLLAEVVRKVVALINPKTGKA